MNIVTIGGGDRTPAIKKGLELAGDPASVLIIPSAASTERSFDTNVGKTKELFDNLGVDSQLLHGFGEKPSLDRVQNEMATYTLIYTVGGNTPHLLKTMAEHGSDEALKKAIKNGAVHVGGGSGALLPFDVAQVNPAPKPAETEWDFEYVTPGIDAIPGVGVIHAGLHDPTPNGDHPDSRLDALMANFPNAAQRGFALDSGVSAVFGDNPEIITTRPDANIHYVWKTASDGIAKRIAEAKDLATRQG